MSLDNINDSKTLYQQLQDDSLNEAERNWLKLACEQAIAVKDSNPKRPDSVETALELQKIQVDIITIIAALMSAPSLQQEWTEEKLKESFNDKIAALVQSVRWLHNYKGCSDEKNLEAIKPEQAERVRRMILSLVEDVRAILIKLAFRLKRLHYLPSDSYEVRKCIAQETLDIYTPLANRLGIAQFKWEMEDLSFRYLNPLAYKFIAKSLEERRAEREQYVENFVQSLKTHLEKEGIRHAEVVGRPKHIYSIWKKMQRKKLDIHHLYDVRAVRVLVDTVPECYLVLGIAHQLWQPITQEFDDYISHPKENGYSSLHTAVIGPGDKAVEIQIRTRQMHKDAELGVAAHWKYKEGGSHDEQLQKSINALRKLLDQQDNDDELLENFNQDLFTDRVFVFTPDGDVHELPKGSTPLDFAYRIHTSLGHKCRGALVNGKIVALTTILENGDEVEILTRKHPKPSRDWMHKSSGYVFSSKIRTKIRNWFNTQDREKHLEEGQLMLEQELNRLHIKLDHIDFFIKKFHCESEEALYIEIGKGKIQLSQIVDAWNREYRVEKPEKLRSKSKVKNKHNKISVKGVDNLLVHFPQCCSPVPYDEILGYITQGKGISVHRKGCPNIQNLNDEEQKRLIEVEWDQNHQDHYPVDVRILSWDRPGLLKDITLILAESDVNVLGIQSNTDKQKQTAVIDLTMEVQTLTQLSKTMNRLHGLPNIISVERR